ncbi:hypothetical protein GCM10007147_32250 [Nocardiopsis kunsanensis]|uniref:Uncharacterized protein n=1 Tax=Nocardiopsis kunsanensis TaxID=141693 RepID=A0A918XGN3_9ACTN|nr:hypothetical protein GCM10007147_32250 [Nocardiopsis kunsanensis]
MTAGACGAAGGHGRTRTTGTAGRDGTARAGRGTGAAGLTRGAGLRGLPRPRLPGLLLPLGLLWGIGEGHRTSGGELNGCVDRAVNRWV